MNFSMHMVVSHRNMISIFDMSKNHAQVSTQWQDTVSFKEGYVRKMFIKKIDRNFQIERAKTKLKEKGHTLSLEDIIKSVNMQSVYKKY